MKASPLRRAASSLARPLLHSAVDLAAWRTANAASFAPPICNKMLHKADLSVMGVGGPNTRTDFHLEDGAEFFWQVQGNMELPIIERGRRRLVRICEGEVFLLPPRVPHSPQRMLDSFGIVIERERAAHELDGLRWYTDFEQCDTVLWERYFHCADLGRDLVPVVEAFKASAECASGVPGPASTVADPPLAQDYETVAPPPFNLQGWLDTNAAALAGGARLELFPGVRSDLHVSVCGGEAHEAHAASPHETWLHQLVGDVVCYQLSSSAAGGAAEQPSVVEHVLAEGSCGIVPAGVAYSVRRPAGSIGLVAARLPPLAAAPAA